MKETTMILVLALLAPTGVTAETSDDASNQGFIYGTVETESDRRYTGLLRWGTEETFWDDMFNSTKGELELIEEYGEDRQKRERIKVLGITVGYRWDQVATSRMFIARFGDIREIEVRRGERITVTMKDDSVFDMEGGSNDVGATVTVWDDALGRIEVDWDNIRRIRFRTTPTGGEPPGRRLFGRVDTEDGPFEGFIQWDVQECLSTDRLDGDNEDGSLSIEMGGIRSIEKRNSRGSHVELKDGRRFVLEDSNDVDSRLRGIHVEDPRYGRVKIPWEAFERVEFRETDESGRGYDDYRDGGPLTGSITDYENKTHSGHLVFDLDERAGWEILNGSRAEVEYYIPFAMIRSVEPQRGDESKIVLRNGEELVLGDGQDVAEGNAGVVVIRDDDRESYFRWREIRRVTFD